MKQLCLFEDTREQKLEKEVEVLKVKYEKLRRSFFSKHSELMKVCLDQKHEIDTLKTALCRNSFITDARYEKYKISSIDFS